MKPNIHPVYKPLKIIIDSEAGMFIDTYSTKGGEVLADHNFTKMPAWTGDRSNLVNESNQNISSYNKRFAGLTSFLKPKATN